MGCVTGLKSFACGYGRENCKLQSEREWYKVTASWVGPLDVCLSVSLYTGTCVSVS